MRIAALAAGAGGFLSFVLLPILGRLTLSFDDYQGYLIAAKAAMHHGDLYAEFVASQSNIQMIGFDYPPLVAWLLQPLVWLPAHVAPLLWLGLIMACSGAAAIIIAYELLPSEWPRLEIAVLATFLFAPSTLNLGFAQVTPIVFLFLGLALRAWVRGHEVRCGVFLGVAACIKVAPLVLIVLLLRRRWWKGSGALIATVAAGVISGVVLLGVAPLQRYVAAVLPLLSRENGWIQNQSLSAVVNRLFGHSVLVVQPANIVIDSVTAVLALLMIGLAVSAVRAGPRAAYLRAAEFGGGVLALLMASTIAWLAHYQYLLIPLAAGAGLATAFGVKRATVLRRATMGSLLATAVIAPLVYAAVTPERLAALSASPFWWPFLQLLSLPAFTAAALLVVMTRGVRRERSLPSAA